MKSGPNWLRNISSSGSGIIGVEFSDYVIGDLVSKSLIRTDVLGKIVF
jgi:hypothetical protein